jgi:hypothetical protein
LDEAVADAIFGNVGTIITFRIGAEDAELLEKEFMPEFTAQDLVNLGFRNIYLKLMIDGVTSHAFSAMTMDTLPRPDQSHRDEVIEYARSMYAHPRAAVEEAIAKWRAPIAVPEYRPAPQAPRAPFPSESRAGARPMQPRQPRPPMSLRDLNRRDEKPKATGASVSLTPTEDLKSLISKALGKK